MYDYLAKIILLGPSGSGKYVDTPLKLQTTILSPPRSDKSCWSCAELTLCKILSRSCLLHRFVKNEWRILSSQTIGVEFASKIIKVGTGSRRKRIKLQVREY